MSTERVASGLSIAMVVSGFSRTTCRSVASGFSTSTVASGFSRTSEVRLKSDPTFAWE
jgi:hypothetical protein